MTRGGEWRASDDSRAPSKRLREYHTIPFHTKKKLGKFAIVDCFDLWIPGVQVVRLHKSSVLIKCFYL